MSVWAWILLVEIGLSVCAGPFLIGTKRTAQSIGWSTVELLFMAFAVLKLAGAL